MTLWNAMLYSFWIGLDAAQEKRVRKSRRKEACVKCNKIMSWEYYRNQHIHKVHDGKKVQVKVIPEAKTCGSSQAVDVRNFLLQIR